MSGRRRTRSPSQGPSTRKRGHQERSPSPYEEEPARREKRKKVYRKSQLEITADEMLPLLNITLATLAQVLKKVCCCCGHHELKMDFGGLQLCHGDGQGCGAVVTTTLTTATIRRIRTRKKPKVLEIFGLQDEQPDPELGVDQLKDLLEKSVATFAEFAKRRCVCCHSKDLKTDEGGLRMCTGCEKSVVGWSPHADHLYNRDHPYEQLRLRCSECRQRRAIFFGWNPTTPKVRAVMGLPPDQPDPVQTAREMKRGKNAKN
ncbi:unnamed protein product, partial [Mesorhabditis spiculigera]